MSKAKTGAAPSLDAVRQRIDALDTELLRLVDERASLARIVAAAKQAAGDGDKFALRPAREAAILRRLIAAERTTASPSLIVRVWREMIGDSLSVQGPFHLTVWGGKDPGRACVPEKNATANSVFRATNYPSGAVDPTDPNKVVVTFGSYINQHSNEANGCVPTGFSAFGTNLYTGVKTPGACNNDILVSVSTNKGATFTGTTQDPRVLQVATTDPGQATTDQWWQWIDFTKTGKLATSYYDRQYGTDEATGYSDVSVSGSKNLTDYGVQRATSSSMPPPTQFDGVFFGDYTGLVAPDNANPLWMDTRTPELFLCPGTGTTSAAPQLCTASASNAAVANDQELRTANVAVTIR